MNNICNDIMLKIKFVLLHCSVFEISLSSAPFAHPLWSLPFPSRPKSFLQK